MLERSIHFMGICRHSFAAAGAEGCRRSNKMYRSFRLQNCDFLNRRIVYMDIFGGWIDKIKKFFMSDKKKLLYYTCFYGYNKISNR